MNDLSNRVEIIFLDHYDRIVTNWSGIRIFLLGLSDHLTDATELATLQKELNIPFGALIKFQEEHHTNKTAFVNTIYSLLIIEGSDVMGEHPANQALKTINDKFLGELLKPD